MTVVSEKVRTLKAANPAMKNIEIARRVGCSPANVTQVLSRIPCAVRTAHHSLTPDEMAFLEKEAKRHELTIEQMSVALLRDAIYDARHEGK